MQEPSPHVQQQLERQRRLALARFIKTVLATAVVTTGVGAGILAASDDLHSWSAVLGAAAALTLLSAGFSLKYFASYRRTFKTQVMASLVHGIDPGLTAGLSDAELKSVRERAEVLRRRVTTGKASA